MLVRQARAWRVRSGDLTVKREARRQPLLGDTKHPGSLQDLKAAKENVAVYAYAFVSAVVGIIHYPGANAPWKVGGTW